MKTALDRLTDAQVLALAEWIKAHGVYRWKDKLRVAWACAGAGISDYSPELQNIRNNIGNAGLNKIFGNKVIARAKQIFEAQTTPIPTSCDEASLLQQIGERAEKLSVKYGTTNGIPDKKYFYPSELAIRDATIAHSICPMRLTELLASEDHHFAHDVFGIRQNLDRDANKLLNWFTPRFAKPETNEKPDSPSCARSRECRLVNNKQVQDMAFELRPDQIHAIKECADALDVLLDKRAEYEKAQQDYKAVKEHLRELMPNAADIFGTD